MTTLVVVLFALIAAALACALTRRASAAWLLIALSALWMPVNNGVWEGRVLLILDRHHGLTTADMISVGGFVVAGLTLWLPEQAVPRRQRVSRVAGAAGLIVAGLVTAYFVQN